MIVRATDDGLMAFPQSARAFLSFQLADHWGNRTTPRPRPRAEVLAALVLQGSGWGDTEEPPRLEDTSLPAVLDSLPDSGHEAAWRAAVERLTSHGRYIEYLVSHHVSHLASQCACASHQGFLAEQAARRQRLVLSIRDDPRYRDVFRGTADATNRSIVRLCDAIAVSLTAGAMNEILIAGLPRSDGSVPLCMKSLGRMTYRLRPWPFAGHRLRIHAEGRFVPTAYLGDEATFRRAWASSEARRTTWTLLAAGTPAD